MISGIFASNQGIVGDRAGDFASAILRINPTGMALMLALSSGMAKETASDTVYHWFEDVHVSGRQATASGGTTTTVVVADGSGYVPGAILFVEETGEYIMVTAVSGNSLTVVRGMSGTTNTSITSAHHVQLIGNAHEEGSAMPVAVTQQGNARLNFTQIFRNAWAVTGSATAVKFRTGDKVAKNKADCALYHAEDQERSLIWGAKHNGILNGKPFRLTDGVKNQIVSYGGQVTAANTGSVAGNFSRVDFEEFIRIIFSKNVKGAPNERIAFCGDIVLKVLNQMTFLDGTYQISAGERVLGIMVTKIQTPFGTLSLMTHPIMNENPVWQKELYALHPAGIKRKMFRETFQDNFDKDGTRIAGIDAVQGCLTTELGIQVGAAQTMGILTGVTTAVASS